MNTMQVSNSTGDEAEGDEPEALTVLDAGPRASGSGETRGWTWRDGNLGWDC